jgi:fructose-bisphosphate aldolase, class II
MSLVNLQPWIVRAQRGRFAIGAFNANTMEQAQAIIAAAQIENAPAMIQVSHRALQYIGSGNEMLGLKYFAALGKIAAQSVSAPIALHLDHGNEMEVMEAITLGFTSVMFDGGDLPMEENIAVTKRLRALARANNVAIEAEVSAVPKPDNSGKLDRDVEITEVQDAADFVNATGVDNLAIAIGSIHAVKAKTVALDLKRLQRIHAAVDTPLVLHGSSGVLDSNIAEAIQLGIVKINVATQLNQSFTDSVRAVLEANPQEHDPRKYLGPAREATIERVRERIRFFGSNEEA